jgi:hypothetical protein
MTKQSPEARRQLTYTPIVWLLMQPPYLLRDVLVCCDAHVAVQVSLLLLLLTALLLTLLSLGEAEPT